MTSRRSPDFQISWTTISYRSVAMVLIVVSVVMGAGVYLLWPNSAPVKAVSTAAAKIFEKFGFADSRGGSVVGPQQAHFTALDGTVRVKKAHSNSWMNAVFNLPLDKGDVIQTSSEGMAKIVFSDGTSYTVKPDSLIVVEENFANAQQQTQVAVQVTTGTVDLSTGLYSQGSTSQVIVAGATASLAPESSAVVRNDPRADLHEILLKKGSGEVTRNNESVSLSDYERVSFKANEGAMIRTREIGPPTLISPAASISVFLTAPGKTVDFGWSAAPNSESYRLRVSRNQYFSSTVVDRVVHGTETKVAGLREGSYYWSVIALDAAGNGSVESERNQFSVVLRASDATTLALELEPFVQHGHVINLKGKTEPGARVMVNGQEVPLIRSDGSFSFFTPPLPNGENVITVTAQNSKGGVKTQQKKVIIE